MSKYVMTDGQKTVTLWGDEGWTNFSVYPRTTQDEQYSRVAAAFRAYNIKANTIANMPFVLLKGEEEFDNSASWQNKVKFLPNPSELLRLNVLSLIATNTAYNLRTTDALGYKTRGLYHAVAYSFTPWTNPATAELQYIERYIGSQREVYQPDDKRLVRLWRLDHTTEVLPSENTEACAIMSASGQVYYADMWISHFYQRGGIAPTLISMKGLIDPTDKETKEKSWSDWLLGLGKFGRRIARIFNAEQMDVKQMGSSVTDLKNNEVYRQALENIAMGTGMPMSVLLSNSANKATADTERATWYDSEIIPYCNWIAYEYNRQVWEPLGLRMEFRPETVDTEQEDETARAQAISTFMDFLSKCPTFDIFIGTCSTFGYELSDDLASAAESYYADKKKAAEDIAKQTQNKPVDTPPQNGNIPEAQAKSLKAHENSTMIALRIPDTIRAEIKDKYPFVDSETLNDLHITLIYLGDSRTLSKVDVIRAATDFAMYQSPIKGKLQGLARFINGQDVDPLVVTFDSPQLPQVYPALTSALSSYHIPYHKEHGFIPHMTLAYIPKDSEMPIETIEPIEINFSDVYVVTGNEWLSISLVGYENKNKKWIPSLDELRELKVWQDVALRRFKKGDSLNFEYQPHYGGLPDELTDSIRTALLRATTQEEIKAAFVFDDIPTVTTLAPAYEDPGIKALADALNTYAAALKAQPTQTPVPNVNITMPPITMTANMPEQKDAMIVFSPTIQPAPVENNITVEPTPITNRVSVDIPKPIREIQKVKRNKDKLIDSTDTTIEYEDENG